MSNSFPSSFIMLNVCAAVLGHFLITCLTIFSFNNCEENRLIFHLSLHCSAVELQFFNNSSPHL